MKSAFGYREAQLNLSGAFGTIAFGRMGQLASANGSFGLLGQTSPFSSGWGDSIGQKFVTADGWTRFDNTITYATPDFAGFKVYAQYSLKNSSTEGGDEGKSSANRYYGIAATYKAENLYLVGIVDSINHGKQMYFGGTGYNYTYDADQLTVTLGGNYDFGVAKVFAMGQYFNGLTTAPTLDDTLVSATDATDGVKGFGFHVGTQVPAAGGLITVGGYYSNFEQDGVVAGKEKHEGDYYGLAARYEYDLSKRTMLYAGAGYGVESRDKVGTEKDDTENQLVQAYVGLTHRF